MRILGISGSPRSGGNTEHLLLAALAPFRARNWDWDVETFFLSQHSVAPCNGCDTCCRTETCLIADDMAILYKAYDRCDDLLVASPVYSNPK